MPHPEGGPCSRQEQEAFPKLDFGCDDMNEIAQIVATIGFPSAVCLLLLGYVKNLSETHREESKAYQQSINANTNAINELTIWLKNMEVQKHEQN